MIYIDTSFFFPLFYEGDKDHKRVREVFEALEGRRLPELLLTSNHVVFETITLTRVSVRHAAAAHAAERLYSETRV